MSVDYSSVIQALGVACFRELVVSLRPAVTFANHHEADLVGPSFPAGRQRPRGQARSARLSGLRPPKIQRQSSYRPRVGSLGHSSE